MKNKEPWVHSEEKRQIEIYIHIPFCVKKCGYCDFLSFPSNREMREYYVQALIREIRDAGQIIHGKYETTQSGFGQTVTADPAIPGCYFRLSGNDQTAIIASAGPNRSSRSLKQQGRADMNKMEHEVTSVFIGGGTPSVLFPEQITRIMDAVRDAFCLSEDAEVSIEVNPGTTNTDTFRQYRKAGINRVSIGCQSMKDDELKRLGRIHTHSDFLKAFRDARDAGFTNINIDLISAIPGQRVSDWKENLQEAARLNPEHISAYSLILEEGTYYYEIRDRLELPDEDEEREIYECTREVLAPYGYRQYEISNYAKPGSECRHNIGYWTGVPYLGFGLGASSLYHHTRFKNTENMEQYCRLAFGKTKRREVAQRMDCQQSTRTGSPSGEERYHAVCMDRQDEADIAGENRSWPREDEIRQGKNDSDSCDAWINHPLHEDIQHLSGTDEQAEFMILGLRMTDGISCSKFQKKYGKSVQEAYGEVIRKYGAAGLLETDDGRLRLTRRGISLSNVVMAEFLP